MGPPAHQLALTQELTRAGLTGVHFCGMKKHVRVLEEALLVSILKVGRTRLCHLGPRRLDDIQVWVEAVLGRTKGDRQ